MLKLKALVCKSTVKISAYKMVYLVSLNDLEISAQRIELKLTQRLFVIFYLYCIYVVSVFPVEQEVCI